jgi:AAHS family 4-hydroxybenzoate transporter-like MFS transporter
VNVSDTIDRSRLSAFQIGIMVLCAACLIMDGFDVQAMGYIGPTLIKEWHIPSQIWGRVVSSGLVGVLVGSLGLSMLADRIGRRPILVGSCLFFSLATLLTARANSVSEMLVIRFVAGIGLGAIMPNAMALVSEYTPRRNRVAMMMIVSNGFTAGGAIVGFVAAWLIPLYGWRAVFYCGGALPLLIGTVMFFTLPESLAFLVLKGKSFDKVTRWLKRIDPSLPVSAATQFVVYEREKKGFLFLNLFREGRTRGTILIWLIYFMNLLNLYFLAGWLPAVASAAGHSVRASAVVGTMEQVGGMIGALFLGWFVHRSGFVPVLTTCFTIACVAIAWIGQPGLSLMVLLVVVFIAGFGIVGGQAGVNAMTGTYYPTDLRSTGLGAGLGIGRLGSILGPTLAGELLARHWSSQQLFLAAAVPAAVSAIVMLAMRSTLKPHSISAGAKREVAVP